MASDCASAPDLTLHNTESATQESAAQRTDKPRRRFSARHRLLCVAPAETPPVLSRPRSATAHPIIFAAQGAQANCSVAKRHWRDFETLAQSPSSVTHKIFARMCKGKIPNRKKLLAIRRILADWDCPCRRTAVYYTVTQCDSHAPRTRWDLVLAHGAVRQRSVPPSQYTRE